MSDASIGGAGRFRTSGVQDFAASELFDRTFQEGMELVEETAAYLDGSGRQDSKLLSRSAALAYAGESMRLTTRLMQVASWLLVQRAVREGDMAATEACQERYRIAEPAKDDYAEDRAGYGEPDAATALAIESVRRDYFLNVQGGRALTVLLDAATLPPKTAAVRGINWLPRLIPKARAKLRGELPASLMYCCGGDRAFFSQHDIYPAEFLPLVWRSGADDEAIVDWVARRAAK